MVTQHLAQHAYAQLSDADEAALTDLYRRGTPANTLRTWERDLAYIAAWKMASFGRPLNSPEDEKVALRFILDHAQDLTEKPDRPQPQPQTGPIFMTSKHRTETRAAGVDAGADAGAGADL